MIGKISPKMLSKMMGRRDSRCSNITLYNSSNAGSSGTAYYR